MTGASILALAGAALSGGVVRDVATPIWRMFRRSGDIEIDREQHINLLRSALDKRGIRLNSTLSACDLLLLALTLVDELPAAAERAKLQAREKIADAVHTLEEIDGGAHA